jgi:hypothetical protein
LVSDSGSASNRDSGSPTPTHRPEEIAARPASSELRRPNALGWAFPPLVTMALCAAYRKARNGGLLASKRVPLVLAMEESSGRTRKAGHRCGGPGVDSQDEFSESALGSATDPWGTAQARYRSVSGHRSQVYGPSAKTALQAWRTFLHNHANQWVSADFFVVPTATFRVLYVFIVLAHERRRLLHFNVTAHPTSEWTAQQVAEAFPWDTSSPLPAA